MNWKHFANWWKVFVSLEVAGVYFIGPFFQIHYGAWDLVTIGLFQYGLFFPVDASLLIGNLKGTSSPVKMSESKEP